MADPEKTVVLNVRVSEKQAAWLKAVAAKESSGNVSRVVRQALGDSWFVREARREYRRMREMDGFSLPRTEGEMTILETMLVLPRGGEWEWDSANGPIDLADIEGATGE